MSTTALMDWIKTNIENGLKQKYACTWSLQPGITPTHLHNCVLCSCRLAVATTCPTLGCKTQQRPSCSCRRPLPPRTAGCLWHRHLRTQTRRVSDTAGRSAEGVSVVDGLSLLYLRYDGTCSCQPPVASCWWPGHKLRNSSSLVDHRDPPQHRVNLSTRLRLRNTSHTKKYIRTMEQKRMTF